MTGFPVRKAKPAGDSRSAPTLATPTTPGSHPTPARTSSRFSAGMCSRTLENSAPRPRAARQRRFGEQLIYRTTLQGRHAKLGKNFLLQDALAQRPQRHVGWRSSSGGGSTTAGVSEWSVIRRPYTVPRGKAMPWRAANYHFTQRSHRSIQDHRMNSVHQRTLCSAQEPINFDFLDLIFLKSD